MNSCDLSVRTSESVCFGAPVRKVLSPDRMEGGRRREGGKEGKGGSEGKGMEGGREGGRGGIEEWTDTGNGGGGVWLGEDGE